MSDQETIFDENEFGEAVVKSAKRMKKIKKKKSVKFKGKSAIYSALAQYKGLASDFEKYEAFKAEVKNQKKGKSKKQKAALTRKVKMALKKVKDKKKRLEQKIRKVLKVVLSEYKKASKGAGDRNKKKASAIRFVFTSNFSTRSLLKAPKFAKKFLKAQKKKYDTASDQIRKAKKRRKRGFVSDAILRTDLIRIAYLDPNYTEAVTSLLLERGKVASTHSLKSRVASLIKQDPSLANDLLPLIVKGGSDRVAAAQELLD